MAYASPTSTNFSFEVAAAVAMKVLS